MQVTSSASSLFILYFSCFCYPSGLLVLYIVFFAVHQYRRKTFEDSYSQLVLFTQLLVEFMMNIVIESCPDKEVASEVEIKFLLSVSYSYYDLII